MPDKFVLPTCKGNYQNGLKVSVFSFPSEPNLKQKWIQSIKRDNYQPTKRSTDINDNLQLSILPDRAQGGSSVNDGSIELMIHRRLLYDDGFGVNEALNEPGFDGRGLVVRGSHFLTLGKPEKMVPLNKRLAKSRFHYPLIGFAKVNFRNFSRYALREFRGLTRRLPQNIHVLTLEKLDNQQILLRLEHFYEKKDDPYMSHPVTVSLSNLFRPFRVLSYQETNLAANKFLFETERLKWPTVDTPLANNEDGSNELNDAFDSESRRFNRNNFGDSLMSITLKPMEIRTFILNIDYNANI